LVVYIIYINDARSNIIFVAVITL